jgi:hypothetical protein
MRFLPYCVYMLNWLRHEFQETVNLSVQKPSKMAQAVIFMIYIRESLKCVTVFSFHILPNSLFTVIQSFDPIDLKSKFTDRVLK